MNFSKRRIKMSDSRLKESNIKWLGKIPKDWNLMPIKYGIKNSVSGDWGTDPLKKSNQKKCTCLRVADFDFAKGIFKQNQYTIRAYSQEKINQLKLQSGDILIEKSGGGEKQPVGRAVLFDKDFPAMFANFLVRIRTNKLLVPSFLEYYLRALYYTGSTRLYFNQTTGIQNLKIGTLLSNEKIPNISIALQNNIVNYLNKRCKKVDDIIAKIQQEITDLEDYQKSIITKAVTKGLDSNAPMKDSCIDWIGKIPQNWKIIKGKYIFKLLSKPVKKDDQVITCFRDGQVTLRIKRRTTGFTMSDQEIGYQGIDKGDLVVHGMDGFAGAIGISDSRGKGSPVLNVLDSNQNKKYMMYCLRATAQLGVFQALAKGIRVRSADTRWPTLANLKYVIPPQSEQINIVNYLSTNSHKLNAIIQAKKDLVEKLNQYKQSIIYEYVTGKKQVPTEEGAEE